MTEPSRRSPGTGLTERIVFFAMAMGGVYLFTLLPTEGSCADVACVAHRYDYEISWWLYLVALAVTEAALRFWQIKKPDTSRRGVTMRIGIRVLVACTAFTIGYFARADVHAATEEPAAIEDHEQR